MIAGIDSLDWSTASEPGETHAVAIAVEGGEGGHRTVQALAAEVRALLHDAALPLAGHHLVNLRHESTRTARSPARRGHVAMLVFRAVTGATAVTRDQVFQPTERSGPWRRRRVRTSC